MEASIEPSGAAPKPPNYPRQVWTLEHTLKGLICLSYSREIALRELRRYWPTAEASMTVSDTWIVDRTSSGDNWEVVTLRPRIPVEYAMPLAPPRQPL